MEREGLQQERRGQHGWRDPWNRKRGAEIDWHPTSSHLPTSCQCLPRPSRTEASWHGDLGTRILLGLLPALKAPAGWAVDSTSLPNVSFLFFPSLPPSIPQPSCHGMPKQLDWGKRFASALSANHSAAFTIRSECLTVHV